MTRKRIVLYRCLLAAGVFMSVTAAFAVPRAAEHEDAPVTFGDAAPPPKPAGKAPSKPAATAQTHKSPSAAKASRSATARTATARSTTTRKVPEKRRDAGRKT